MGDKLRGPKTFIARIQESQESYEQFMRHKKYDSAVFEDSIYLTLEADFKKEFPENYLLWKEEKDRKSKLYYFVIFFEANQNFSLIKGCISYITDEVMFSAKAIIKESSAVLPFK